MNKKIYFVFFIFIALAFSFGYFFSSFIRENYVGDNRLQQKSQQTNIINDDSFAAGWVAARKRLEETGYYFMDITFPVMEIWGEITNIDSNKITLSTRPLDPLADKDLDERIVMLGGQTGLLQLVKKDRSDFDREVEIYNEMFHDLSGGPLLPEPYPNEFTESAVTLSALRVGQQVKIEADNDIRNVKEFSASKIVVLYSED